MGTDQGTLTWQSLLFSLSLSSHFNLSPLPFSFCPHQIQETRLRMHLTPTVSSVVLLWCLKGTSKHKLNLSPHLVLLQFSPCLWMAASSTQLHKPENLKSFLTFTLYTKINVRAHLFSFLNMSLTSHFPPIPTTTFLIQVTIVFY